MPVHRHPVANTVPKDPLTRIPLDHALIARLKSSYAMVRKHDLRLAEVFYHKLFTAAPHLRSMFRTEPKVQAAKLIASLDAIVANLVNPEANAEMLTALGQRHAGYGAKPEHYTLVIELLVESMREVLQPTIDYDISNDEPAPAAQDLTHTLDEWRTALTLISRRMIEASGQSHSAHATDH